MQLVSAVVDAQPVRRINYPDESIGLFKVVSPIRPQRLLASYVPCVVCELQVQSIRVADASSPAYRC